MTQEEKILKTELKDVCYIGEEGDMAVSTKTVMGALRKFRKQVRKDCGEDEAKDIKAENISIGWLRLCTEDELEKYKYDDIQWVISYRDVGKYPVFIHSY